MEPECERQHPSLLRKYVRVRVSAVPPISGVSYSGYYPCLLSRPTRVRVSPHPPLIALSFNGRTLAFEAGHEGSNPSGAATLHSCYSSRDDVSILIAIALSQSLFATSLNVYLRKD